jgi:multiple sugar transport system ATP-binding protein
MTEILLKVENLRKTFGNTVAVDDVTFEVRRGEFFSLLGPSGCGKTTTLRCIAGLEKPDKGRIIIGERDVTNLPPQMRNVGLVFQEYAVFPHMTVYENMAFGLKIKKLPKDEIHNRVLRIAELLNLEEYLNVRAGRLALALMQRVALARSIIVEPEILLLDEPLTLVDAKIKELMRRELRRYQKELGVTILHVTHDQLEAMMVSDRIGVMCQGKILQIGTPIEIYDKPNSIFVARFIGSPTMNLIEGRLEQYNDELFLDADDVRIPLYGVSSEKLRGYIGKDVVLGVRPEDIEILTQPTEGSFAGKITLIESSGSKLEIIVELNSVTLHVLSPLRRDLKVGQPIHLKIRPTKAHVFNKTTENNIMLEEV